MPQKKISCHGTYSKTDGVFLVPNNTEIYFYCDHGEPSNSDFCRFFENRDLTADRAAQLNNAKSHYNNKSSTIDAPLTSGQNCRNYKLEPFDDDGGDAFFTAPKKKTKDMYDLDGSENMLKQVVEDLAHLAKPTDPLVIHCLFCRVEIALPKASNQQCCIIL